MQEKAKLLWDIGYLLGNNLTQDFYKDLQTLKPETLQTLKERLILKNV